MPAQRFEGFRSPPILTVAGCGRWALVRPLVYVARDGEALRVPAGFITDLASIPRLAQPIVPVNGCHRAAAILHDYLFVVQDRPRQAVDALFLEAMALSGVRWTQRHAMHAAVRLGGWLPWRTNARARAADLPAFLARHGLNPEEGTA